MTNEQPDKKPRTRKPAAPKTPNTPNALRGATDTPMTIADSVGQLRVDASTSDPPGTPQTTENRLNDKAGGDRLSSAEVPPLQAADITRGESQAAATRRWRSEGIADQVAVFRDRIREEYRDEHPGCRKRDAHEYAWTRAMAEFGRPGDEPAADWPAPTPPEAAPAIVSSDDMGVSGLGDMPPDWPQLPANAQLQVEIAWVSANRLRVRSGSGVDLSRALSPAPSYSALSWLETSILFPAKFADISVKATAQQDDEREGIRREKLAIDEIRGLLAEMLE